MGFIADGGFREPIVIQGSAGCGKSTFTLRLAHHLYCEGLRPIRIRLRDIVIGKELYTQLGEAITFEDDAYLKIKERFPAMGDPLQNGAVFQEEVPFGRRGTKICPYVLILDGWDEISVAVSEGLKGQVKELLLRIRAEFFRAGRPLVRVILTGRPSDAIDECTEFFRDETPRLTIRTLNPEQLPEFASKLRIATEDPPLVFDGVASWRFPTDEAVTPLFRRYRKEIQQQQRNPQERHDEEAETVTAVLGYPLLLHFAFRLLAEPNVDTKELIESPTALLRRMTDFATARADTPSDAQPGARIPVRFSGSDLRCLLRRTAAQMTILGGEHISQKELEKRLSVQDLASHITKISKENVISALLVSFYFKGGN
ncbi:MAG: hypothetical protein HY820_02765 [Acidobacteria bacterium]|nr:hypothetical protein [Acidobacteriota bacterium]